MAHVSRPLLIVLAATVALMAVWLVALRPQPIPADSTPLGATKAIPQAEQAAATANAANAKVQAAAGNAAQSAPAATPPAPTAATPATPATPPAAAAPPSATPQGAARENAASPKPAAPAKAAAKRSLGARRDAAVVRDVKRGKVVVLLFWNANAADDVATRGAVRAVDRRDGKVVVHLVPIADVAQYTSVTKGVKIAQSPTTVVIGRKGRTRVITGLTEPHELSQAVGDALAGH